MRVVSRMASVAMFEIGNSLREARLRQQLDFPAVEQGTKIRGKYLRALEDERFELLPGHAYIKGFLRTYADFLGLDGGLYVDEYNSRFVAGDEDQPPLRTRRVPMPRSGRRRRFESGVVLLALTAIVLVTALVIVAWKFGGAGGESVQGLQTAAVTPAVQQAGPKTIAAPSSKPGRAALVVGAVKGDSWMEVRAGSGTGRLIYGGTLERGQSQRFVQKKIYVAFGNPENVSVKVNGLQMRLPATSAAFLVTPEGLSTADTAA